MRCSKNTTSLKRTTFAVWTLSLLAAFFCRGSGPKMWPSTQAASKGTRINFVATCLLLPLDCDHFWVLFSHNEFWESMGIVNSILRLEPWKAKIRLFILVIGLSPKTFLVFIQLKAVTNPMQTKKGLNVVIGLCRRLSNISAHVLVGTPQIPSFSLAVEGTKVLQQNAFQVRKGLLVNKRGTEWMEQTPPPPQSVLFSNVRTNTWWCSTSLGRSQRSIYGAIIEGDIPSANLPAWRGGIDLFKMK